MDMGDQAWPCASFRELPWYGEYCGLQALDDPPKGKAPHPGILDPAVAGLRVDGVPEVPIFAPGIIPFGYLAAEVRPGWSCESFFIAIIRFDLLQSLDPDIREFQRDPTGPSWHEHG